MSDRHIIAFSGKKGSGKDTCCKFIHAVAFVMEPLKLTPKAYVNSDGHLIVATNEGENGFNLDNKEDEFVDFMSDHIWPFIRKMAFADPLKETLMNLFGIKWEQLWGTDDQKNEPTPLLWENFPGRRPKGATGHMSAREVMQYWGTEIFRKQNPDVWTDTMVRRIKRFDPVITIITDVRFPNEIETIQSLGGKVIRLTRGGSNDEHDSEKKLDKDVFDWAKFDAVIENDSLSIDETNEAVFRLLSDWDVIKNS